MNENKELSEILHELLLLASEGADVRAGLLSDADFRNHCEAVEKRIQAVYPLA